MAGSTAVPTRVTVCGLVEALLVKVSVPVILPNALGAKITKALHLWTLASTGGQSADIEKLSLSLRATLLTFRRAVPVLVNHTVLAVLISPSARLPKLNES